MLKVLVLISCLLSSVSSFAMDHREQFGVGGGMGGTFPAPWASPRFLDKSGPKFPAGGLWVRYIPGTPEIGLEISYHYFALSKQNIQSYSTIFSFISRQNPWGSFHPFYAFGVGYGRAYNWYTTGNWDAPVIKITAGIEFEMSDRLDVGLHIDHFSIFKNLPTEPNLHVLSPKLVLNYYFGSPAPMPQEKPVPSPVAAPAPAAAAPAPTTSTAPEATVQGKQKPKSKPQPSKKPRKKPAKRSR